VAPTRKNIYFASDFHLGVPDHESSLNREKLIVAWLDEIKPLTSELFLMGDLFDFWFEYRTVVPKGYVRLLGKLAEFTDAGIPVHVFRGNHDIWAFDYLQKEIGVKLYRKAIRRSFNGKKFFLAHGDGLGPGDTGYKILKKVFESRFNQFFFKWLHPDIGTRLGLYFSRKSRIANVARDVNNKEKIVVENEMLYRYCMKKLLTEADINYFIFGHRHVPIIHPLNNASKLVILGDWVSNFSYAIFDGETLDLRFFNSNPG
jgi:UDP-2,3-diacylglucosamine hydrolase